MVKYYYIKYTDNNNTRYRGMITQAKCERSALFWISQRFKHFGITDLKLVRCCEISYKTFKRLEHLEQIRIENERKNYKPNSEKLNKALNFLNWVNDNITSYDNSDYSYLKLMRK